MSPLGQFPRWATRQIPIGYVVIFYPTPPPAIHWPKRGDQQSIRVAITPDVRILGGGRDHRAAKQLGKLHRISINNVGRWRVIRIGWPVLLCLEMRTIRTYESSPRWFGFVFVFFFFCHSTWTWNGPKLQRFIMGVPECPSECFCRDWVHGEILHSWTRHLTRVIRRVYLSVWPSPSDPHDCRQSQGRRRYDWRIRGKSFLGGGGDFHGHLGLTCRVAIRTDLTLISVSVISSRFHHNIPLPRHGRNIIPPLIPCTFELKDTGKKLVG